MIQTPSLGLWLCNDQTYNIRAFASDNAKKKKKKMKIKYYLMQKKKKKKKEDKGLFRSLNFIKNLLFVHKF